MGAAAQPDLDGLAPEEIRSSLDRIVRDERFVRSQGLCRFLRYTVEETLSGRGATLKESVLGLEVFARGNDFDPRLDPIVRIQAGKLRTRLTQYYQAEGGNEAVIIEYHKGSYTPVFRRRSAELAVPQPLASPVRAASRSSIRTRWVLAGAAVAAVATLALAFLPRPNEPHAAASVERLTSDTGASIFPAISNDGKLVAYASDRAGNGDLDLWVRSVSGGEALRLTDTPGADITPDFSPDGQRVVFRSNREESGLYMVRVLGGKQTRLTNNGWQPRFSPDGNWIVYLGTGKRPGDVLWVIPSSGGQPRPIEIRNDVRAFGTAVWTPDSRYILFIGFDQNRAGDWWLVSPQGGDAVRSGLAERLRAQGLGELEVESSPGDWLGNEMLFSLRRGDTANLWLASFSTHTWKISGPLRQVTFGSAMELWPRASSNGRIVFSGDTLLTHLWSVPIGSGEPRPITQDSTLRPGNFRGATRFSATDRLLAFASPRSGNSDIWLKDLVSGTEQALASTSEKEERPLLSPDGKTVVYLVNSGGRRSLYTVDVEQRLSRKICDNCGDPYGWLPDSRKLLFGASGGRTTDLAAIDVFSGAREQWVSRDDFWVRYATVSPDGQWAMLVTTGVTDGRVGLNAVPLEGGAPAASERWVAAAPVEPEGPVVFSQSGDRIYYLATADGFRCLWTHSFQPSTGTVGPQKALRHFHNNRISPWNSWLSLSSEHLVMSMTESTSNLWSFQFSR